MSTQNMFSRRKEKQKKKIKKTFSHAMSVTLLNTSRYPYLDISDLQNEEKINQTTTFNK